MSIQISHRDFQSQQKIVLKPVATQVIFAKEQKTAELKTSESKIVDIYDIHGNELIGLTFMCFRKLHNNHGLIT